MIGMYEDVLLREPLLMAEYAVPGIVGRVPTRTGLPTGSGAAIAATHTATD